ncbi:MAG: M6 family metalloprotease domain-containing protein [Eubacteriales bacterium]|nr:M6 family metalloprotease domain-containing protein [Eubacteriales bacterium]
MRRKIRLLLMVTLLCWMSAVCALASPAYPGAHTVTEPATGTQVCLYDRGDEHFSYMTDAAGCIVEPFGGYFWHVRAEKDGLALAGRVTLAAKNGAEALRPSDVASLRDALTTLRNSLPSPAKADSAIQRIPDGYHAGTAPNDAGYGRIVEASTYEVEKPAREASCPLLVLHIQYADMPAAFDDASWHKRIFEDGVPDYYAKASEGAFTYTPARESAGTANDGVITVTLPISAPAWARGDAGNQNTHNGVMAGLYHGSDGKDYAIYNESSLFLYALAAAAPYLPDLSVYDRNGDGFISPTEMAFLVVSSGGEASAMSAYGLLGLPAVWAHSSVAHDYRRDTVDGSYVAVKLGGVLLYKYTIMGEAASGTLQPGQSPAWIDPVQLQFGTACHELGHDLGLMDLYDTGSSFLSEGVNELSLMSGGNWGCVSQQNEPGSCPTHLDAFSKAYLGFADPQVISADGVYTLSAPESAAGYSVYRINTPDPDIYYLLENRRYLGYDRGLTYRYEDFATRDGGIVIWRIDDNAIRKYWELNTVNNHAGEFGVMPVYHNHIDSKPFYGGYDFTSDTLTQSVLLEHTTIKLGFYAESAASMDVSVSLTHQVQPPVITTAALPDGNLGNPYSAALLAVSDLPVTWRLTQGRLPDGLLLMDGTLRGIASAACTFTFTVSADNGVPPAAEKTYTVAIGGKQPPVITTESLDMGYVGDLYGAELSADGAGPFAWRILDGQLPQGLSLTKDGRINGTPEAPGNAAFTVGVSNGVSPDAQKRLSIDVIVIEGEPILMADTLSVGFVGIPYSCRVLAAGTLPIRMTLTDGALPEGLTFADGLISGTPVKAGDTVFTITASNGLGTDAQTLRLYIRETPTPPRILTDQLDDATLGIPYNQDLSASGGGVLTWRVIGGRIPDGLAMSEYGAIAGTPLETGTFAFTAAVSNGVLPDDEQALALTVGSVQSAPVLWDESLPMGAVDEPYGHVFRVTGGENIVWQLTGKLPAGLSFMNGEIGGIPRQTGVYPITITVQNGIGPDAVKTFSLRIYDHRCSLTAFVSPREAGAVVGAGDYYDGDSVTLTANPNAGYRFVRWMDTDAETEEIYDEFSDENPLRFIIEYGMALTAEFARITAIVTQPVDCTALAGDRAVFSVEAVGDKLQYQWAVDRRDGRGWQILPGAVSSAYRTGAVTLADDGCRYRCVITDAEGQTFTTAEAVLRVSVVPPATGDAGLPLLWGLCLLLGAAGCVLLLHGTNPCKGKRCIR